MRKIALLVIKQLLFELANSGSKELGVRRLGFDCSLSERDRLHSTLVLDGRSGILMRECLFGDHLSGGLHGGELVLRLRNFLKNGALAELARTGWIDAERCRGIIGGVVLGGGFVELDRALLLRG